jgi:hypothetical protein
MNSTNLPPLPTPEQRGSDVCARMALYIAVWQDLAPAQKAQAAKHIQSCETCTHEYQLATGATKLIARLSQESTVPSARVDQAVMQAIAARRETSKAPVKMRARTRKQPAFSGGSSRMAAWAAVAAAVVVVIVGTMNFIPMLHHSGTANTNSHAPIAQHQQQQAFALPTNLSWNSGVIYQVQAWTAKNGEQYQTKTYYDPSAHMVNAETTSSDGMDVVVVEDQQANQALGMDMTRHVAQWNAQSWATDESMFNLKQVRSDLQSGKAVYLGKGTFQGQPVYEIRCPNNQILLLNMNYMPVNVLQASANATKGQPVYNTVEWLQSSQVPDSMWDMNVPQNFKMGSLPSRPE